MDYLKQNHLSLLIIAYLVIAPFVGGHAFGALDRTTIGNPWTFTNTVTLSSTLKIGTNGATITELNTTSCNLSNADTSVAATSTGYVYCAITGVASGDVVFAQLATTTANAAFGGWSIYSAKASTTAGFVDIRLYNGTGAAAVPSVTSVGSSTNVLFIDN